MSQKHAVIYIPGLGDSRATGQRIAINSWKLQGIEPHFFQMLWMDGEGFQPKLERLLAKVDSLTAEGRTVSLISASAGASAALNAYANRQDVVHGLVSICGKLRGYDSVSPVVYGRNPAFQQSMEMLPESERLLGMPARGRILSMHALADESVPIADSRLPGSVPRAIPLVGHVPSIAYGLTIGSFGAIRFLKDLKQWP